MKVVVIGGGTGTSTILRGLKRVTNDITAIICTTDDGGGSGILREDYGMIPPGDFRNCLIALSNSRKEFEDLLNYRYKSGTYSGQSFGNLFIAAISDMYHGFESAIDYMGKFLNITGKIYPVTLEPSNLEAILTNGTTVFGETNIREEMVKTKARIENLRLSPHVPQAFSKALDEIEDADFIFLGPGSLYSSTIANLLVDGVADAIYNTKAKVIYIANAFSELGESESLSLSHHVLEIEKYSKAGMIDYVFATRNEYLQEITPDEFKGRLVLTDDEDRKILKDLKIEIIEGDFVDMVDGKLRHNGEKIGNIVKDLK